MKGSQMVSQYLVVHLFINWAARRKTSKSVRFFSYVDTRLVHQLTAPWTEADVPFQQWADLSLATDVFLNLLIVTESSCNRSQPRRFSAFFREAGLSVFPAGVFSYRQQHQWLHSVIVNLAACRLNLPFNMDICVK